ncbi:MAG: GntR family transcriptional regulator [Deferrisomatales bacterium]
MNLKERVVRELRLAIADGQYGPGEHLTEAALCERFKVSRTPVREALNQLEREGFVRKTPAAGVRVTKLTLQEAKDVYDLLIVLESAAARFACINITDEQIRKLVEYNILFERAAETSSTDLLFQVNLQFHWLITEATHNAYLIDARDNFRRLVDRIGRIFPRIPEQIEASLREHRQITDALKTRNAALTEFLMREHLEKAKKRLFDHLQQEEEKSSG